jgi:hypothetical protein
MSDTETKEKPYTKFCRDWEKIPKGWSTVAWRKNVLTDVENGVYGSEVAHSVFGIGHFDPTYDLTKERQAEITKDMKFYAKLE